MNDISNHEFINFFSKEENKDIQKNFFGVFHSDFIYHLISFHSVKKENRELEYPFFINEYR